MEPGGVLGEAALGGDEDEVLPVRHEEQGRGPQGAALRPDVVEQQHPPVPARHPLAEPPTRPPVEERVGGGEPVGERPEPVRVAEVERLALRGAVATVSRSLSSDQVYIPPNMPPVMFSTWPCT